MYPLLNQRNLNMDVYIVFSCVSQTPYNSKWIPLFLMQCATVKKLIFSRKKMVSLAEAKLTIAKQD
jgi:hypothetical protein